MLRNPGVSRYGAGCCPEYTALFFGGPKMILRTAGAAAIFDKDTMEQYRRIRTDEAIEGPISRIRVTSNPEPINIRVIPRAVRIAPAGGRPFNNRSLDHAG